MLDLKRIRTDFDAVAEKLATRGVAAEVLNQMKEIDEQRRDLLVKVENLKAERNTVSAEIAQAKRNKENADDKIAAMQKLSAQVKDLDATLAELDAKLTEFTTTLPNIPHDSVPVGADEDDNVEVRRWGTPRQFERRFGHLRLGTWRKSYWSPLPLLQGIRSSIRARHLQLYARRAWQRRLYGGHHSLYGQP